MASPYVPMSVARSSAGALAAELVRLKVDVIVTAGPAATRSAKMATVTIPIVITNDSDPVANGFVASLARPGGNITGLSTLSPKLGGKQLELLRKSFRDSRVWRFSGRRPILATFKRFEKWNAPHGHYTFSFNIWTCAVPTRLRWHSEPQAPAALTPPWDPAFLPDELVAKLRRMGFSRVAHLSPESAAGRYVGERGDGLRVWRNEQMVIATV
jgi:hypothetical protein